MIMRIDNDMTEEMGINITLITNFEEKIISFCLKTIIGQGLTIKMNKIIDFIMEADHIKKTQELIIDTDIMEGFNITILIN